MLQAAKLKLKRRGKAESFTSYDIVFHATKVALSLSQIIQYLVHVLTVQTRAL